MSLESSKEGRSPESGDVIIIPREIFTDEILPRIPATNLQSSLKLVCKDWLNPISSPRFIRRQLLLGSNRSIRILVPQANGIINIDYDKHQCVISSKEKEVLIPFPPKTSLFCEETETPPRILGSCDGLILLANENRKKEPFLVVFNPSTRKSELFPLPERKWIICSWFGHHPATGEYVLVLCDWATVSLHTFSRENKLRAVKSCSVVRKINHFLIVDYESQEERGILLEGVVYWPAQWTYFAGGDVHTHTISGYRIRENEHFEFSPPRQTYFKLGVLDGCLLSINKTNEEDGVFEVWVMTKETSEWTKYRDIEGGCNDKFEMLSPLTFFSNGDLFVEGDACILTRYDFNRNKATFLNFYYPPTFVDRLKSKAIVCADSLLSPAVVKEEPEEEL